MSTNMQVYNTLTRRLEPFEPIEPSEVRIYACGITVYDEAHIGHASQAIIFDVIRSYLEYAGLTVTYVRNFTDIDDKIIAKSHETGKTAAEISNHYIEDTRQDLAALKIRPASFEPKVTDHVQDIIDFVQGLIDKQHAYVAHGDVYFDVTTAPGYGKLSHRSAEDVGAEEEGKGKRHVADFALWKSSKPGEPSWESPWGPGRPGWHIECSVMARKYLGDTFDVHGGGMDLVFPHHENEIAQTESYTGKPFAKYWIHNGLVMVDNQKMSKSLGNFYTIKQALAQYPADVIRYVVLTHHYSSNIDFSEQAFRNAEKRVLYFYRTLQRVDAHIHGTAARDGVEPDQELLGGFERAMNDNFNTAEVVATLSHAFASANEALMSRKKADAATPDLAAFRAAVTKIASVLRIFDEDPKTVIDDITDRVLRRNGVTVQQIEALIDERARARAEKDYARADEIRDRLQDSGIALMDGPDGTEWEVSVD